MAVDLASLVVDVPDVPSPGVTFDDITPLLGSPEGLAGVVDGLVRDAPADVDAVLVRRLGAEVAATSVLLEVPGLGGRAALAAGVFSVHVLLPAPDGADG